MKALIPILCLIANLGCAQPAPESNPAQDVHYEPLVPAGEIINQGGIYDPSLKYGASGKTGYLVYSAIHKSGKYPTMPVGPYIGTHLARSTDGGKTWTFIKSINDSIDATIKLYNGETADGVWCYEVPSLAYDPGDPGKEWKLFAHRYFWTKKSDRMPAYGWIAYRYAHDPAGQWSEEIPLFGAGRFPPAPYDRTKVDLNALSPDLSGSVAYSEPGSLCVNGVLYVSLTALDRKGPEKIFLLASNDHGATWTYVATLVTNKDAEPLGYRKLDASSLVCQGGRVFLCLSPASASMMHNGTLVVEFTDLSHGQLKRDSSGKLSVIKQVPGQTGFMSKFGAGQSDYDEHNTYGGIIFSQANFHEAPHLFQIFSTRQRVF